MNKLRIIIQEEIKRVLTEEEIKDKLESLDDLTDEIAGELENLTKSLIDQNKEKLTAKEKNEAVGILAAGILLSVPVLLKYILSPIIEKISRSKYAKQYGDAIKQIEAEYKKQGKKFYTSEIAAKVKHLGEEIHHAYVAPLKLMLKPFIKDEKKRNLVAEIIYAVFVLFLAGHSANSALSATDVATGASEAAIASVKGIDFTKGVTSIVGSVGEVLSGVLKAA